MENSYTGRWIQAWSILYILGSVALDCDRQALYTQHIQSCQIQCHFFPIFSCSYRCYKALFFQLRSVLEPALVDLGSTAHPPLVTAKFTFLMGYFEDIFQGIDSL